MEKTTPTVKLDSVETYNNLYGLPTVNPLATVVNLRNASRSVNHVVMDYDVYALFLKNNANCRLLYGRHSYDCQEGTVVTFAPGQVVGVDMPVDEVAPDVVGLVFHPDLIYGTPLGAKIAAYSFFGYSQSEALHLSDSERAIFLDCLDRIAREINLPADSHSTTLISSHIQLLLDYLARFYDRQFDTRRKVNSAVVEGFERNLRNYYYEGRGRDGVPTVAWFAEMASLTPGYFGDLIKRETGATAQDFISRHIVGLAKHRLASSADDVSQIAYGLGFQYPQHFARLFKRLTGLTPTEFRRNMHGSRG